MDSLKIPKGGNSGTGGTKPSSVPITVRFNAGEESIDDMFQPFHNSGNSGGGDSLSSSPSHQGQQNADDLNMRNNFLQGNFFNRKSNCANFRSGSSEGGSPISLGPNLITAFASGSETNSVGTWQLIKGKVSQTIEDIKASKNNTSTCVTTGGDSQELDSDWEIEAIQPSISDEPPVEQGPLRKSDCPPDAECDPQYEAVSDKDGSHLHRSRTNLKSKVKVKPSALHPNYRQHHSPKTSVVAGSVASAKDMDQSNKVVTHRRPLDKKWDKRSPQEIESGVEMMEDMVPGGSERGPTTNLRPGSQQNNSVELHGSSTMQRGTTDVYSLRPTEQQSVIKDLLSRYGSKVMATVERLPYYSILGLVLVMTLSMPGFVRGVLACLLASSVLGSTWTLLLEAITDASPERSAFKMPTFRRTSIFEIPAVEEHKTVKSYTGWMNEIRSYDPQTYHISMTESVYVRLDGTILRVSNTTARIPKRLVWNEKPIDLNSLTFTQHRTYDLFGCRVDLLPIGLAQKRYFNRKYPIQLIVKRPCVKTIVTVNPGAQNSAPASKDTDDTEKFYDARGSDVSLTSLVAVEDYISRVPTAKVGGSLDFGGTIMNADLQTLQTSNTGVKQMTVPFGDETRLLLFSRGPREKEDWYRRFVAASKGEVHDKELKLPNALLIDDSSLQEAADKETLRMRNQNSPVTKPTTSSSAAYPTPSENAPELPGEDFDDDTFAGLVFSSTAGRNPKDYIRFMALYQKACNQTTIPVYRNVVSPTKPAKRTFRRARKREDEVWKGIDQSLFLGPSGSMVWFNVIIGRFIYSFLHNPMMKTLVHEQIQKKIATIKLPSFIEDVTITDVNLGDTPPLIHRTSRAMLDERGIWVDADVTYEGLLSFTVSTKLNLMRLKSQGGGVEATHRAGTPAEGIPRAPGTATPLNPYPDVLEGISSSNTLRTFYLDRRLSGGVIYDSDAESMGSSSSESDLESDANPLSRPNLAPPTAAAPHTSAASVQARSAEATTNKSQTAFKKGPQTILRLVDRLAASNFFQYATDLPYIQRAIENMNSNITLGLEIKGVVARVVINLPPPPSDRIWIGFRGPPRLWLQAKPTFGEKSVDWSFLTSVIETKICEQINKMLVYPNMVDIMVNILGQPTTK